MNPPTQPGQVLLIQRRLPRPLFPLRSELRLLRRCQLLPVPNSASSRPTPTGADENSTVGNHFAQAKCSSGFWHPTLQRALLRHPPLTWGRARSAGSVCARDPGKSRITLPRQSRPSSLRIENGDELLSRFQLSSYRVRSAGSGLRLPPRHGSACSGVCRASAQRTTRLGLPHRRNASPRIAFRSAWLAPSQGALCPAKVQERFHAHPVCGDHSSRRPPLTWCRARSAGSVCACCRDDSAAYANRMR